LYLYYTTFWGSCQAFFGKKLKNFSKNFFGAEKCKGVVFGKNRSRSLVSGASKIKEPFGS
jgi:hypothetical protein